MYHAVCLLPVQYGTIAMVNTSSCIHPQVPQLHSSFPQSPATLFHLSQDTFHSITHLSAHPPILKCDTQLAKMVLKLYRSTVSTSGTLHTILEKKITRIIDTDRDVTREHRTKEFKSVPQSCILQSLESVVFLYLSSTQVPRIKGLVVPHEARIFQATLDLDIISDCFSTVFSRWKYVGGDELSLAGLFCLPNGVALKVGKWKEVLIKYLNVDKWFRGLQKRDMGES